MASGAVLWATDAYAGAAVSPGQGSAYAQSLQMTPHEGSLAVGAVFGEALAGHTNTYARAQSQGLDLGAIGTAMKSYNCGSPPQAPVAAAVPSALEVEAGQPGAAQGETNSNPQQTYGATEYGQAKDTPYAEADTTMGSLPAGVMTVTGATTKAWSGIVAGQRVAGATSDIGSISFLNGMVVLDGLHWNAAYPSSGSAKPNGTFSISKALVKGVPEPTNNLGTLTTTVNQVIGTLGIQIVLPQITDSQGIETVTPLQLKVVPNQNRDTLVDAALNASAPAYNAVTGGLESGFGSWEPTQLEQALCQSDTPVTVVDVTLASVSGAGYFNAALGGVNASSKDLGTNGFNLGTPAFSLGSPGTSQFVPGNSGAPGSPALAGSSGSAVAGSASTPGTAAGSGGASGSSSGTSGHSVGVLTAAKGGGGPLLVLGLAGLAAAAASAELDRRRIRRLGRPQFED